jgi:hypothetical protein
VSAIIASFLAGSIAIAQQAEVAAPPANAATPGKAKAAANADVVVVEPAPGGGTPTPSVPPSDYWYCTCKSAISE